MYNYGYQGLHRKLAVFLNEANCSRHSGYLWKAKDFVFFHSLVSFSRCRYHGYYLEFIRFSHFSLGDWPVTNTNANFLVDWRDHNWFQGLQKNLASFWMRRITHVKESVFEKIETISFRTFFNSIHSVNIMHVSIRQVLTPCS